VDLEQQLRSVLTDDRLDVHLGPGAVQAVHDGVRRRKRRNAALSAAASFVLVAGGIATGVLATQGGSARLSPGPDQPGVSRSPKPGGVKPPAQAPDEVPWAALPYNPSKPFALPGTTPQPGVPSCNAGQLSLTASQFQGATGSAAGGLTVTNNGATCGMQGSPQLTGYGESDKVIATSQSDDPFIMHPWFALRRGQQAQLPVQIFGDGSRCDLGPVKRLSVEVGAGGNPLSADVTWVDGRGVKPRCGTAPKSKQLDHYIASAGEWTRPDGSPHLPMADFSADSAQEPTTAMQGTTIRYQVLLSTGGAKVRPCLPYREQVIALDGTQTAYGTAYFRMNCAAMSASLTQGYTLDMQLALPKDIPVGTYALQWQTPIRGLSSGGSQTLQVTTAPPMCTSRDLGVRAGRPGAATTHYARAVIVRNTSSSVCSIRGYPGIEFDDASGHPLPTNDRRTLSAFMWHLDGYETLRLAPGQDVSFALGGVDYDVAHNRACPTAPALKVIAPGDYTQLPAVGINWPYCFGGQVDVSPFVAGTRGPR
jgi:hypothetical protein